MQTRQSLQQAKATHAVSQTYNLTNQQSPEPSRRSAHPTALIQRVTADPTSLTRAEMFQLQRTIGNRAVGRLVSSGRTMNPTDAKQRLDERKKENATGLPDQLKAGIETLSSVSLDEVRVHYNSAKPAQLQALAYTQGAEIHLGPGQEKHLSHEAWHVVQQKQGRVQPTKQLKEGLPINDNAGLEREADAMSTKALTRLQTKSTDSNIAQLKGTIQFNGRFIGDSGAIHLHIDIASPHLKLGGHGKRIDIAGPTSSGYSTNRLRVALDELTNVVNGAMYYSTQRGYTECLNWLCDELGLDAEEFVRRKLQEEEPEYTKTSYSAYDDPSISRASKELIEEGWKTGEYPPRQSVGTVTRGRLSAPKTESRELLSTQKEKETKVEAVLQGKDSSQVRPEQRVNAQDKVDKAFKRQAPTVRPAPQELKITKKTSNEVKQKTGIFLPVGGVILLVVLLAILWNI